MPECKYQYKYCFDADCRAKYCTGCGVTVEQVMSALAATSADFVSAAS